MRRREAQVQKKRDGTDTAASRPTLDAAALFVEAVRLHQVGDLPQAEAMYRRLVVADPGNAAGWSNLGLALVARGAHAEAVVACRHAISTLR